MLELRSVTKRYPGGHVALDDVTFQLAPGEFAYITGPSGSGKTTLLNLIPLIERPSDGRLLFSGDDVTRLSTRHVPRLRRRIGMVLQDCKLIDERNVFSNVALPLQVSGDYTRAEIAERVQAALDRVGLTDFAAAYPSELSTGERQRVAIARAVVGRPALLLADEPTGSVDAEAANGIMQLFEQFNRRGVAVLIATHDQTLLRRFPHRTWTLRDGRLIATAAEGWA